MEFEAFLKLYDLRVKSYVSKFRKAWRLPHDLQQDLYQVSLLAVWKNLPYWKSELSEGREGLSAFNWCAGPMRRAMEAAMKSHHGLKPFSGAIRDDSIPTFVELENTHTTDNSMTHLEDTIDLKRLLQADPKPSHVVRFIATALSPASGADIARAHGISRQAVCISVSKTRKRLRSAWG